MRAAEMCQEAAEGGRPTFSRLEYILLFKGRRRLSTGMGTTLENNYAFSKVIVKFCETFICATCKQHKIKNKKQLF